MHGRPSLAAIAALAVLAPAVLAGCAGENLGGREGAGTDPSLPGVRVSGTATWDGEAWTVLAGAVNEGPRTYRVASGCDSPFRLEAQAEEGDPYLEVQCLAYTEPVPFGPGDRTERRWEVRPEQFGWSGDARFTVVFEDAQRAGTVRVALG